MLPYTIYDLFVFLLMPAEPTFSNTIQELIKC